ncbi:hypothetical protein [Prevotella sp. OH937_COT-195]|uniref:hypothetical protein n=1 Tax=Prevotella sp. OH937_COT-195 TaxID=2491051 RepID=UPI000F64C241|nr:hypothetical protein [Prevotella sp. OH937_COT-195]RRC99128.1 hypothetical protein EII32_08315 [Prevotella sp. OH937_COT-195]
MKKIIYTIIAILCFVFTIDTMAKDGNKVMPSIYVFGVSTSFNDSLVFFTDIITLDNALKEGKTDFILSRGNYSIQLREYLESKGYLKRTCVFVYGKDLKKVKKKYEKMKSRYTKKNGCDIILIEKSEFVFTPITPSFSSGQ